MASTIDDLYRLEPGAFTAARDALAKQLRADGRRDEAADVKALRRPTVAAWALNQVAHRDPDAIAALLAAGGDVAAAQRRALSGVKEAGLREASQRRRARIDEVWKAAAAVLRDAGVEPTAHRQSIADTLEAAALDAEAGAVVRAGRLTKELPAPSGFGDVAGFTLVAAEAAPAAAQADAGEAPAPDPEAARTQAVAAAAAAAEEAEQAAVDLEQRAGDARQAAVRTNAEAERLQARASQVRERADTLAAEADSLAAQAAAARVEADDAARRLGEVQQGD